MKKSALFLVLALAACDETVQNGSVDEPSMPTFVGEGLSVAAAEAVIGPIFEAEGCSMSIRAYLTKLDEAGYAPELHDITTPEGHRAAQNRAILEATPMDPQSGDRFSRSGSKLTSHIGGCA